MQAGEADEFGTLHVEGSSTSFARQRPTAARQSMEQEQQQTQEHVEEMNATQPVVKLVLDARKQGSHESEFGRVSVATETWLERATAKAKASIREKSVDSSS